jgi:hypothetical protein
MKPATSPVLRSTRLLNQVREHICYKHYSLRAEKILHAAGQMVFFDGMVCSIRATWQA